MTSGSSNLKLDTYLEQLDSGDKEILLEVLHVATASPRKIAAALTNIGMPISREAITTWRRAKGILQ